LEKFMKTIVNGLCLTAVLSLAALPVIGAEPPASTAAITAQIVSGDGPKIQFDVPAYDFGKGQSGEPVKHTFIFTNTGNAELLITDVHPGCGCTTAGEWTKKAAPGQTGTIPIQVNTANLGAGPITKMVTVTSNDKQQPSIMLQIKGTLWKPIEVNPQFAVMNIPSDSPTGAVTKVSITSNMEEPIYLHSPEVDNKSFTLEIKTNTAGKSYDLMVTAVPPLNPGNVQGHISIKTSSTNMPTVTLTAWANVQPPLTVMPGQVTIAAAPLASKTSMSINIQNNGTSAFSVSDPAINIKDVDVQLREVQTNRLFTATLTFPQGFEIPPGQQVQFTVKTTSAKMPVVTVPVVQMARPISPVVPIKPSAGAQSSITKPAPSQ
jgi:hypothetical protein